MQSDQEEPPEIPQYRFVPCVEPSPRWVRVRCGGQVIADSKHAWLLRQYGPGQLPAYYFPPADVRMDLLQPAAASAHAPAQEREYRDVCAGDQIRANAAWIVRDPPDALRAIAGHVSFAWSMMDGWYEEEEEIFVHARDPHMRVDALQSSRHVRVELAGTTLADTRRPVLLFETSLPTRYYVPREDVRHDLLVRSELKTRCPYKGIASYWSVRTPAGLAENVVWSYEDPIRECPKIRDLMCFFNEHVDVYLEDQLQPRPLTPWSK